MSAAAVECGGTLVAVDSAGSQQTVLAIHGFWSPRHGVCVWAEDSDRKVKSSSQAVASARPHPLAVTADLLADLFGGTPEAAMLVLPSVLSAPLDSPGLVRVKPRRAPTKAAEIM